MTFNVSYIHKNLALRWLFVTNPSYNATIKEYTLKTNLDDVICDIESHAIDVIGLSVYIFNHEKTKEFIARLKQEFPSIRIIVGGPEVTYQVNKWLEYGADYVIRGEGELVFWKAVNNELVEGIAVKSQVQTPVLQANLALLETFENPYFLEMDRNDENHRYLYLEASRGCPFSCTYCMAGIEHGVRVFSMEYVLAIIERIKTSKVTSIKFLDRTFNSNPLRALTLISALNDLENEVLIQLEVEVSIWDDRLHNFFMNQGKRNRFRFEIGVQTFHQPTLKSIKRKQNNEKLKHVISSLTNAGYVVHADLIGGLPYENMIQFTDSFHQLLVLYPSEIQLGILKGLSGTKIVENAEGLSLKFDEIAPYIIQENPWMSMNDLNRLEWAALAIEKIYNTKRAITLIKKMEKLSENSLEWLANIGERISMLHHPYQVKDVIACIINETTFITQDEVVALLAYDLGKMSKTKVKQLPHLNIDLKISKTMEEDISQRLQQNVSQWRSNSWLYSSVVKDKIGYQWIVYGSKKRYYYTEGAEFVYEQDHISSK